MSETDDRLEVTARDGTPHEWRHNSDGWFIFTDTGIHTASRYEATLCDALLAARRECAELRKRVPPTVEEFLASESPEARRAYAAMEAARDDDEPAPPKEAADEAC